MLRFIIVIFSYFLIVNSSFAEKIDLKLTGQKGDYFLFTVPKNNLTKQYLRSVVDGICNSRAHCYVMFWQKGEASPKKIPLTDKEVSLMVASYRQNKSTKLQEMIWSCSRFSDTPKDMCF